METRTSRSGLVLALACLAQFMVVLDIAIVNVALPSIQRDLSLGQSMLEWVVIAYGLLLGGFILLGGRLGDLLGRRRILITGLALFSGASLTAGLSQSAGMLIAARAFQGLGAALIAPTALSILAATFDEGPARNRALGIYGAVGGSSASVGVIASGLLTDGPGWRWIFFINVPVGVLMIALATRLLPSDSRIDGSRGYDVAGASSVTGGLLLFVYALNRGAGDGWLSLSTIALFAGAALLLARFVQIEARTRHPLVPAAALRNRMLIAADLSAFMLFGAFYAFLFLGTLLMQQMLRYTPTGTGAAWLATSLTAFVAAAVAGSVLVSVIGVRRLLVVGMAALALGGLWLTQIPRGAGYSRDLMPALLLAGVAVGLCAPTLQIGALSGVSGKSLGLASGLVEMLREIGGATGIAAASTVLISNATGRLVSLEGFRAAFIVVVVFAAVGTAIAAVAVPRVVAATATDLEQEAAFTSAAAD